MKSSSPYVRDLLLVGGGHAHIQVLRRFGMRPEPGVRLTLIAREPHTPYSGMLPGYVAGQYSWDEIHFDLWKLSVFANCRLIVDEVVGVNRQVRTVQLKSRPDIRFDVLSINTGGEPGLGFTSQELITPVKPIGRFIQAWNDVLQRSSGEGSMRLAIVGGGPGSVELALAIAERHGDRFSTQLVTADEAILLAHNRRVRKTVVRELERSGVSITTDFRVESATSNSIVSSGNRTIDADFVLWTGGVEAPNWPRESGFTVDERGFIRVGKSLCAIDEPNIFATGDIASLDGQPRPKSGVYAVREGPYLAYNLRAAITERKLRRFRAQSAALAILRLPRNRAVASRRWFASKGRLVWNWKDFIDRRFMERFGNVPSMTDQRSELAPSLRESEPESMRCGGCGAKLGADVLHRVLRRLEVQKDESIVHGLGEDAAVVNLGSSVITTSCDSFRSMISDPWRFGRIAAHHALNDLYAMGCQPRIALAIVTIPLMAPDMVEDELFQVMSGALSVFGECGVHLVGGHSGEGLELTVGFAVTGSGHQEVLPKGQLQVGQHIVLTKPLGTGVLLAGANQGIVSARHVLAGVDTMDRSNRDAMVVLQKYGATACTDVTGFGLLGHLSEMLRESQKSVTLQSSAIPALPGACEAFALGAESSLQSNNELALVDYTIDESVDTPVKKLLVDPQTSGGLLASLPGELSQRCVDELRASGYTESVVIGEVTDSAQPSRIVI